MKVLYLHQYFKTKSGGTRSYEFSKYLVEQGHNVTMLTGTPSEDEGIDGIKVISTNTSYDQHFNFFRRILSFFHFMLKSFILGLKEKNVDIIYATSTPLTIGFPTILLSIFKKRNFVFEVRDVWPDVPIELGIIKLKFLQFILYKFERIIYTKATHIVVLSDGMKFNLLKKGISEEKITVITNLSMNSAYDALSYSSETRNIYKDKLLCIHPGTMGVVNGLDFILDLAKQYPNEDILYYIIGEGNQKLRLKERIKTEQIQNVIIMDSVSKSEIMKLIKESDIGIMTVADFDILKDNSANKFFDYLSAGIPVLINYEGWQKHILEVNEAGMSFKYNDKEGFYKQLLKFKKNPSLLKKYKINSKKLSKNYDSVKLANKMESVLLMAIEK